MGVMKLNKILLIGFCLLFLTAMVWGTTTIEYGDYNHWQKFASPITTESVYSLKSWDNNLWVGASSKLLTYNINNGWTQKYSDTKNIYGFSEMDGNIWLGFNNGDVNTYDPNKDQWVSSYEDFSFSIVYDMNVSDENLYVSGNSPDVWRFNKDTNTWSNVLDNDGSGRTIRNLVDCDGNLWVITMGLVAGELYTFGFAQGIWTLNNDYGSSISNATAFGCYKNRLYAGTQTGEIYYIDHENKTATLEHTATGTIKQINDIRQFKENLFVATSWGYLYKYNLDSDEWTLDQDFSLLDSNYPFLDKLTNFDENLYAGGTRNLYIKYFPFYILPLIYPANNELKDIDSNQVIKFEVNSPDENNLFLDLRVCKEGSTCTTIESDLNLMDLAINPSGDANCLNLDDSNMVSNPSFNTAKNCYYLYEVSGNPCADTSYYFDFTLKYEDDTYHAHNDTDGNYFQKAEYYTISEQVNDWDNQVRKRVTCIPGVGCSTSYGCNSSALNPWQVGYDLTNANDTLKWRSFWEWNTLNIPSNATIIDIEVSYEKIASNGSPDSLIMATATKPSVAASCVTRYGLIESSTQYKSVGSWSAGWNNFDLGEDAVNDLQGHLDWFATGLKHDTESGGQENWVGLGNVIKMDGAKITITYYTQTPCLEPQERQIYVESWVEKQLRKGETPSTLSASGATILALSLAGFFGIILIAR